MLYPPGSVTVEEKELPSDNNIRDIACVTDQGGNSLKLQRFEGKLYILVYSPGVLQGIKSTALRDDDIYLCAYPRTGTHWVFEMVNMLLKGKAETIPAFKGRYQLETGREVDFDALPSPRLLNTHMFFSDGPKQLTEKKCKVIYNMRDPKDVAVSLYHLYCDAPYCEYSGEFKDFLDLFLDEKVECNGMFSHLLDAEKFFNENPDIPVHFQIYDETFKDPLREVENLSDFLGLQRNNDLCRAIAEKYKFSRMMVDKDPYAVKFNEKTPCTGKVEERELPWDNTRDIARVTDNGGISLKLQRFEGKLYILIFNPIILQGIKSTDLRDDDIYLCAYPRTGTHWVFEMVNMLLKGKAETIPAYKGRCQLERGLKDDTDALPSPRLLNTHMSFSDGPKQLTEKTCKIIYNLRDPKDVAVSLYHVYYSAPFCEYNGEFKDFLYLFLDEKVECNGMFSHLLDAEKFFNENPDIPVHFQIYDETIKDPLREVENLSDFLGIQRNNGLCRAIAEKCKFSRMVVDKDAYAVKFNGKNSLYRKGIVGDWKNWFTDKMLEDYYRVYDEKMKGSRFFERYAKHTN